MMYCEQCGRYKGICNCPENSTEVANLVEPVVISGVAMMYQKHDRGGHVISKVRCVLVETKEDDDEFDLKAKAERYISKHHVLGPELKDFDLVAWNVAIPA